VYVFILKWMCHKDPSQNNYQWLFWALSCLKIRSLGWQTNKANVPHDVRQGAQDRDGLKYSNLGGVCHPWIAEPQKKMNKKFQMIFYNFTLRNKTQSKCKSSSAMLCFRNENMGVSPVVAVYPEECHLKCTRVILGKVLCTEVRGWLKFS